ncbi:MAG: DUF362 domain-containing protein [Armatimonadetes bacterium]|nr:DUF362 domain-containing protein [Armatimonadota bacterium]
MPTDEMPDSLSRREFLRQTLLSAAGLAAMGWLDLCLRTPAARAVPLDDEWQPPADDLVEAEAVSKSPVALLRTRRLFTRTGRNRDVALEMLDLGMCHVMGVTDPMDGWAQIATPDDVVAIKVNCQAVPRIGTHPTIVDAVVQRLLDVGVVPENVIIYERKTGQLKAGGFTIRRGRQGVQCYGTDDVYRGPYSYGEFRGDVSYIVTDLATVIINMPLIKHHANAGVTLSLKNHYGSISNPFDHHLNGCNPYIAHLNMIAPLRTKQRLIVCDGSQACFNGGPRCEQENLWRPSRLLISQDPVALDTLGWLIIDNKRAKMGLPRLEMIGRTPRYLATAAALGLGTNNVTRMRILNEDL